MYVYLCSVRDETTDDFVRDLNVFGSFICLGFGSKKKSNLKNAIEGFRGYIVVFVLLHTFPFIFFYMLV